MRVSSLMAMSAFITGQGETSPLIWLHPKARSGMVLRKAVRVRSQSSRRAYRMEWGLGGSHLNGGEACDSPSSDFEQDRYPAKQRRAFRVQRFWRERGSGRQAE